jgi:uncharacterized phiE125 gp8 family phage protein
MGWHWKLKTDAASEPITTAQAKTHCNITTSDDDTYIDILIKAARQKVESDTDRAFINQSWYLYLDAFPSSSDTVIYLPRSPVSSVTAITYTDTDGDSATWTSTYYDADIYHEPGRVLPAFGYAYPSDAKDKPSCVRVEYVVGYGANIGAATLLPTTMTQALYLLISHWYENREPVIVGTIVSDTPLAYESLIASVKVGWLFEEPV